MATITVHVTVFSLWLLLGCLPFYADSELVLSPSGTATVCPEATLEITCSTDRNFLNWSVTTPPSASESNQAVTRNRLISSSSHSVSPLIINTKVFIISIVSTIDQFTSVLLVVNVTDDLNGTMVQCTDIGSSAAETSTAIAFVHIIQTDIVYSNPLIRTEILIFQVDGITVTLSWTLQHELETSAVAYYVSIIPLASFNRGSRNATLRLSYNTAYAMSIVASVCQRNVSNTSVTLKYAKCANVLHQLGQAQDNIQVIGYSDPALEGTSVTLECSSPNLVLMGPSTTTCMGNGEWEPDPRDVNCAADCGVPLIDGNFTLSYNSTLEGSVVVILCDWFMVRAVCHRNGSWSPHLTDNTCHLQIFNVIFTGDDTLSSSTSYSGIIIFSVVLLLVLLLLVLTLVAIICICLYYKHKRSSKASPDGKTGCRGDTQPRQGQPGPEYETVMDCTTATVDLEMTENVAYAPVHTRKKNKNTS